MSSPIGPRLAGLAPADDIGRAGRSFNMQGSSLTPGANSDQVRTFNLMQRLSAMMNAWRYPYGLPPADTDPSTHDTGTSAQGRTHDWQEYFKVDNARLQVYEDADEMDDSTDEVSAALDTLADSAVNPEDGSQTSFVVEIDEGPNRDAAEVIISQVAEALDMQAQAFSIARDMIKYGDCFVELVVNENNQLCRSKILPAHSMWRNEDSAGNLMQGMPQYDADGKCENEAAECAFDQREGIHGKMIAAFESWQIAHFRWNHRGNDRYGRSMLRTARIVWKKLKAAEEAVIIARLQRAWMRFLHEIDTTGMTREDARAELNRYRQELTKRYLLDTQMRENPLEVTSDYYITTGYIRDLDGAKFLPRKSNISVLQGDHAALAVMTDVEYFQNKLFASLRVPKAYLGFERDINAKATLTTQDIQYARALRRIQACLSSTYKEIFDFGLILAGLNPAEVKYTVRWPAILISDEERDAIIRRLHAEADAVYWQMGAPSTRYLVQERFGFDDEAWEADLLDAMADPPARIKVQNRMPDQTLPTPGANTLADAAAMASANGNVQLTPTDQFQQGDTVYVDQSWVTPAPQTQAHASSQATGQNTGQSNFGMVPSANGGMEEAPLPHQYADMDHGLHHSKPGMFNDGDDDLDDWLGVGDLDGDAAVTHLSNNVAERRAQMRKEAARPSRAFARYTSGRSIAGVHSVTPQPRKTARAVSGTARNELAQLYASMVASKHVTHTRNIGSRVS